MSIETPPLCYSCSGMSLSVEIIFIALGVLGYLVSPVALIWGWVRWITLPRQRDALSILSFVGFLLANSSAVLAIASIAYAQLIHGFAFYDPRLMRVFRWGFSLSLGGLAFGIGGVWRPNSIRWQAPVCALGTLAFWFMAALGE